MGTISADCARMATESSHSTRLPRAPSALWGCSMLRVRRLQAQAIAEEPRWAYYASTIRTSNDSFTPSRTMTTSQPSTSRLQSLMNSCVRYVKDVISLYVLTVKSMAPSTRQPCGSKSCAPPGTGLSQGSSSLTGLTRPTIYGMWSPSQLRIHAENSHFHPTVHAYLVRSTL